MANKPTKAEYEGFKKAVANPMTPPPIKQKLQSIIDQYASEYEGTSETSVAEPKKSAGRKPATPKATKKTATPRATKKTATDIEKAKAEIKAKTGKTEEECEAIIEQYRALRTKAQEGKRKAEQATATNKKRVAKLEDKGDLIEGTNVKTADAVIETTAQEVAEKIEQQIEAVEEKAEKEAKAEVAKDNTKKTPTQKKQAVEAKVEKKVKEKTRVIVKKVVIDTSALLTSIATSLGKFDKDSQKEFLIKLRSDIDKLLSKYAFGGMTDGATQVMNIQQSNLSSSSVNPTMFAKGGGVDGKGRYHILGEIQGKKPILYAKTDDKKSISKLVKQADKDLFDLTGKKHKIFVTDSVTDDEVYHYAKGGGVDGGAKIRIDSVDIDVYEDSYEEGEGRYVNGYSRNDLVGKLVSPKELVSFLSKELYTTDYPSNYSIMDGAIFTSQLVDEDSGTATERQKAEWKKGDLTLYSENTRIGVSIIHPTETTDEELSKLTGIGLYKKGGKVKMSSKFANGGGVDKLPANLKKRLENVKNRYGVEISKEEAIEAYKYNLDGAGGSTIGYEYFGADTHRESTTLGDLAIDLGRFYSGKSVGYRKGDDKDFYANGGVVGQEIVFDDMGAENTGVIKEITNLGDYVVKADDGRTLLAQRDLDVISFGAMRQQGVEQRKKRFGFFEGGGNVSDVEYDDVLAVLEDKLTDAVQELPNHFENSYNATGEEVEHQSRDGFIAFTDGGYEVRWFEYVSGFWGAGYSLPTKALEKELNRQIDLSLEDAKDFFISEHPEIVEELGEDNINYNSLYEAGYESEAEELSEAEMENMDGTIMCEIGAYYYTPNNDRGIEGEHTLRLFGLVNLESPYHRSGNLEDRYDIDITFNSIEELEEILEIRLNEIIDWFNGSHYFESSEELRIRRMAKGGLTEHGLRVGDSIIEDFGDDEIVVRSSKGDFHRINLDKGERFAKGGKLWIDTKGKGGLKGVKPSRKNTFRNEAVKRGLTSGQLASKVLASPSRYKGINPRSAQLVKNMGVRKHGGSIGDILRNRRGE